ncbi:MAG: antirestriction protein ArdA, partial [Alcaligenaceae bacterium]
MPRIYVASLSDYNAGILHGMWYDLGDFDDVDDVHAAIRAMLSLSPTALAERNPAEEW